MAKRFYAVQHGNNYGSDFGSTRKAEALKMAKDMANDPRYDGEEIRISLCTTEDDYCDGVIIVREEFCDGYYLNRPISRERAYYIGWEDYVED